MKRRVFLKGTLVTAGTVFSVSCSDEDGASTVAGSPGGGRRSDTSTEDSGPNSGSDTADAPAVRDNNPYFPQSVASGDPKPSSVVLWTRVADKELAGNAELQLEIAADAAFTQRITLDGQSTLTVNAEPQFDHCAKVILQGLMPATTYYYRFTYESANGPQISNIGRTRTAPDAAADVPVRFAFMSCQDYDGRYYNTHKVVANLDLDFVVHLGDYIYENASPAASTGPRTIRFTDPTGAFLLDEGTPDEHFAAATLSQYRDLYKIYRSDRALQRVHERFPMICIWDDHEFANDSWGSHSNHTSGREDENNPEARKAASQAWFEYMPVDYREEDFRYDPSAEVGQDISIYRDFIYGQHLHLVMTDLRLYRSDHVVPEDAWPARIFATEEALLSVYGELPEIVEPYLDLESFGNGKYIALVSALASEALGFTESDVTGLVSLQFMNDMLTLHNEQNGTSEPLIEPDGLKQGLSYQKLNKSSRYSEFGSRQLIINEAIEALSKVRWQEDGGASQSMMGGSQRDWFLDKMQDSDRTWKVWGNEFCLISLLVDLTKNGSLPENFAQKFLILADDWNSMPARKDAILEALSSVTNAVAITGDMHAFLAGIPFHRDDLSKCVPEFVTGAMSSPVLRTTLVDTAISDPVLAEVGAAALALAIEGLLMERDDLKPNPDIAYAKADMHGFVVIDLDSNALKATFHLFEEDLLTEDIQEDLDNIYTTETFRIPSGVKAIEQLQDGNWKRWNPEQLRWDDA